VMFRTKFFRRVRLGVAIPNGFSWYRYQKVQCLVVMFRIGKHIISTSKHGIGYIGFAV